MLIACSTFSCALACAGDQSRETLRSWRMHGERGWSPLDSEDMSPSVSELDKKINVITLGWKNYFNIGYPRKEFRALNHFTRRRFQRFLRNRSQRRSRPLREGESLYAGLKRRGLEYL